MGVVLLIITVLIYIIVLWNGILYTFQFYFLWELAYKKINIVIMAIKID